MNPVQGMESYLLLYPGIDGKFGTNRRILLIFDQI